MATKPKEVAALTTPVAGKSPIAEVAAPAPMVAGKPRIAPELADVRTDIPMPDRKRGGPSGHYDFNSLATVGASFGIKNKTSAQIGAIVSKENKRNKSEVTDPTNPEKKVTTFSKKFEVFDVDPKTDPDGAKCRVFRTI